MQLILFKQYRRNYKLANYFTNKRPTQTQHNYWICLDELNWVLSGFELTHKRIYICKRMDVREFGIKVESDSLHHFHWRFRIQCLVVRDSLKESMGSLVAMVLLWTQDYLRMNSETDRWSLRTQLTTRMTTTRRVGFGICRWADRSFGASGGYCNQKGLI